MFIASLYLRINFLLSFDFLADFNLTWFSCKPSNIFTQNLQDLVKHWDSFIVLSFGILDEPPCYVRQCLPFGLIYLGVDFTACVFGNALQYTAAHLQVLFSLQHLGGITKN